MTFRDLSLFIISIYCRSLVEDLTVFQEAALERDQAFWVLLCCEFEVHEQLTSLIKILQFLLALPKEKEDGRCTLCTLLSRSCNEHMLKVSLVTYIWFCRSLCSDAY